MPRIDYSQFNGLFYRACGNCLGELFLVATSLYSGIKMICKIFFSPTLVKKLDFDPDPESDPELPWK